MLTQLIHDFGNANSGAYSGVTKDRPLLNRRSGSLGYSGLTGDIHQRLANVRAEIKGLIAPARKSVEEDIAKDNRDKILLALTNFLGGIINNYFLIIAKGSFSNKNSYG